MPAPSVERRLAAVLASEMVGYTGLIEQERPARGQQDA